MFLVQKYLYHQVTSALSEVPAFLYSTPLYRLLLEGFWKLFLSWFIHHVVSFLTNRQFPKRWAVLPVTYLESLPTHTGVRTSSLCYVLDNVNGFLALNIAIISMLVWWGEGLKEAKCWGNLYNPTNEHLASWVEHWLCPSHLGICHWVLSGWNFYANTWN